MDMELAKKQQHTDDAGIELYRTAGDIVNKAMAILISNCIPGNNTLKLCVETDEYILGEIGALGMEGEHGNIPTSISINNVACNDCPTEDDGGHDIQPGDVLKITMGCFIDGHIAMHGHTHVAGIVDRPLTGRAADVVVATFVAADVIHKMFRPGLESPAITEAIEKVAACFKCHPVRTNFTCSMSRFLLEGSKIALNGFDKNMPPNFTVEENEVYNVDIMLSTGSGKVREEGKKPTVYQRDLNMSVQLRHNASRRLLSRISDFYPALPFTTRGFSLEEKLGLKECIDKKLLIPYAVQLEKKGEYVAQLKFTLIVKSEGSLRVCSHPAPFVSSKYNVVDEELAALLEADGAQIAPRDGPTEALPVNCKVEEFQHI